MNKLLIAASLAVLLAACAKEEAAAPAADAAAAPATTEAAAPAVAETAAPASGLPQACEDYLARAQACFAKAGDASAAAFQQGVDQTKAQWETIADKSALETACTAANDQFAQTAAMLKCE